MRSDNGNASEWEVRRKRTDPEFGDTAFWPRDLKLIELLKIPRTHIDLRQQLTQPSFDRCVRAFIRTIDRGLAMGDMPPFLVQYFMQSQQARDIAALKVLGGIAVDPKDRDEYMRLEAESRRTLHSVKVTPRYCEFTMSMALTNLERTADGGVGPLRNGLQANMVGMVIGTWTAFETLAGDLWEAAINVCPKTLAEQKGTAGRIWQQVLQRKKSQGCVPAKGFQSGTIQGSPKSQSDSKQLPLERIVEITEGTFNLGEKMGTLLRSKYDFSVLAKTREAYSVAFAHYSNKVDECMSDTRIDTLNLVRNMMVHNAGVADKIYVEAKPKFRHQSCELMKS